MALCKRFKINKYEPEAPTQQDTGCLQKSSPGHFVYFKMQWLKDSHV